MPSYFLISRPDFDDGTAYMCEWSRELIGKAQAHGFKVVDVKGKEVNEKNVAGRLRDLKPTLVCLNGHGTPESYCGHDFQPVVTADSASALAGTITFVRACDCLNGLGIKAIESGCKAFIGYAVEFVIPIHDQYATTPLNDPVAKPVMKASNEVVSCLIDGKTPQQAVVASNKLAREYVRKLIFSKEFAEDLQYRPTIFALVNNSSGLGFKTA
jgi:hypothetical protein